MASSNGTLQKYDPIIGRISTISSNLPSQILWIQITKSQTDPNISEVKAMHIRDKEFEPFAFHINADSLPELVGDYEFDKKDSKRQSLTDLPEQEHREALSKVFADGVWNTIDDKAALIFSEHLLLECLLHFPQHFHNSYAFNILGYTGIWDFYLLQRPISRNLMSYNFNILRICRCICNQEGICFCGL